MGYVIKTIKRLDDALALIEKSLIVLCFSLLVFFIVFNILSRNIFHLPSHKIFEAGPNLVLWLALLGASLALKQQRHIRLELVLRYCSERIRLWAAVARNLSGAAVMGILLVISFEFVKNEVAMFGVWGRLSVIFPIFFSAAVFRYLTGLLYLFVSTQTVDITQRAKPTR
ncbi:MAG: TRAP transporter small permease subunit [Desulfosarcina sp.]|nr:TRAP transporter small permease subunit [Desulfosarcina sp.]MBC2743042.1 TRAP transporter small permease subunit [Desulfosarcina sp.]MBC2765952.1 TRAP transporter small permease subunit [Desulfosarcina sp.]